jgi:hypothetical protein
MIAANYINAAGFWEHCGIVALNDEILARYGSRWPKVAPLPYGWEKDPALDELRDRALKLIRQEFAGAPLWGWKDPRTCVTLPFWQMLLPRMRYVLCFRNPVDTATSNAKTLYPPGEQPTWSGLASIQERLYLTSLANWLEFVRSMLTHTSGCPRIELLYEDVMEETDGELRRIARFIGRPEAVMDPKVLASVREFKSDNLRHNNTPLDQVLAEPALPHVAKNAFLAVRSSITRAKEEQDSVCAAASMSVSLVELEDNEDTWRAVRDHVRRIVVEHTPDDAQVAVVSHGDDELLRGIGRNAQHFPQGKHGEYLGYHPPTSADAIEAIREAQAIHSSAFLVIPKRQLWWLDHYADLREYLETHHHNIHADRECVLYELCAPY